MKVPIKVTCREYGNDIAFQPDLWLFEALAHFKDAWRAALLNEEPAYVDIVGRFPVSVTFIGTFKFICPLTRWLN